MKRARIGLARMDCAPASAGARPLRRAQIEALRPELGKVWRIVGRVRLQALYRFKDFRAALAFANRVGAVAENQQHHPDVLLSYGRVELTLSTHDVGGLSLNDFILAARIDKLRA